MRAERHWRDEASETVVRVRPQGTFTRRLFLGDGLDAANVQASYENGVLRVRVPIAEESKPRRTRWAHRTRRRPSPPPLRRDHPTSISRPAAQVAVVADAPTGREVTFEER